MAEPGTQKAMCGVCGEWMSREELSRHSGTAHPEIQKLVTRTTRRVAVVAVVAGLGLILRMDTLSLGIRLKAFLPLRISSCHYGEPFLSQTEAGTPNLLVPALSHSALSKLADWTPPQGVH